MYKMVSVGRAKSGMVPEAIAAVKAIVEYANKKYDLKYEVYMQVFGGTAGTIYLINEYKDLDTLQAVQAKVMADEKYWSLVKKAADVSVEPPSMALLRSV